MTNKNPQRCLCIRGEESHRYGEIDVSDWEPGENFIGLSTGEDFPEGEEWFLYYPWRWRSTGLRQGILINIRPDTATVEVERIKIG